ncbi:hypothetical protein ACF05T_32110 [Streptomyces lateritius]|uniref:ATP-dependent DNA ligase family profile domain-containing protein n=1 Tax=Streptomyces lateritius TaxID=67313 RepID=A0ABW6YLK1_9ACTN
MPAQSGPRTPNPVRFAKRRFLSFEALQRRASAGGRAVEQLCGALPAHFIAFDDLQIEGRELLTELYDRRRTVLEGLFAEYELTPPWTLCPMTTDVVVAQEWLESWTEVEGVEGLVIKGRSQRHLPSARGWFKIRCRPTWKCQWSRHRKRQWGPCPGAEPVLADPSKEWR